MDHPELHATSDAIRHRFHQFSPRKKGLIPLRDGLLDVTGDLRDLGELLGDHPMPPVIENSEEHWRGITVDGHAIPGLYVLGDNEFDCSPAAAAVSAFLSGLPDDLRAKATARMESSSWRTWSNAFPAWEPSGVCLQHLDQKTRDSAMRILETSLSASGFRTARDVMRLNRTLGELVNDYTDTLTEWMYFLTIFGEPHLRHPWGWQISGHHLDINCVFVDGQMVLTPTFMGAEPSFAESGIYAGTQALVAERAGGHAFFAGLSNAQRAEATLYPSMLSHELPPEAGGLIEGRHLAGAGHDNRVIPYKGLCAKDLSVEQVSLLRDAIEPYVDRLPEGPGSARFAEIDRWINDTWFAWIGPADSDGPFYYRIHSPVILIEYDNHGGIFFDNDEAEPFHTHTIVRTPNGNDYGKDLLRQHYELHHRPS